jgi:hypothetical protein
MSIKTWIAAAALTAGSVTLTGCPGGGLVTYEIWLVNSSDFRVTNVRVVDDSNQENVREFPDDLAANRTRIIDNIPLGDFEGGTVTVEIDAETGDGILEQAEYNVNVPDKIEAGRVVVISIAGNNILNFNADYVPLEAASQGKLLVENLAVN